MRSSQRIVLGEVIVFLAPVTVLAFFLCGLSLFAAVTARPVEARALQLSALSIVCLVGLASGWRLALAFLRGGRGRLAKVPGRHTFFAAGAAAIVLVALLAKAAGVTSIVTPFFLGAPALVPFAHLAVERFHARS